ncbi:protein adenylyltransferase SelO [Antarcticirhabdus aurantiaca]|uniref:YdiU family protein n=1 Tax=Antarcticirhabdus aurantiaca TaxID=2606717 RepID=A0ACD4NQK3_9HYPH|nr:YdiU family protein [Antarcticirhabdus aurantiaca]WAJ29230.1 YdiU family protein [Jeongeuplla avenae]
MTVPFPFRNSYANLPERFFVSVAPREVPAPRILKLNRPLAAELGLDTQALDSVQGAEILAGMRAPEGAASIALAYAGHQFGHFVPQLGDGRALLLGEVVDVHGRRRDLQLKGSGPTPFSRGADGRAALGPVLREYVVSEAMNALGVPTTRALAAVLTGETVVRETLLPGAVLTRVAASHIRVGTFQFFAARRDEEGVRALADYAIERHYPDAANAPNPYRAFLDAVAAAQADLVSRWLLLGFIHGVMNTDNTAISGETIDYGPCAFMDHYDPMAVFSSIDRQGRYAYANQPAIVQWNLARLAECLLPLLDDDQEKAVASANEALAPVLPRINGNYRAGLRAKLGLATEQDGDGDLAHDLLDVMAANRADFTLLFRGLADAAADPAADEAVRTLFADPAAFDGWAKRWRARLAQEPNVAGEARRAAMRRVSPAFIPRNHRVEAMIRAAVDRQDFAPFEQLLAILARPFDDQPEHAEFMAPPQEEERVLQTFCGT